MKQRIGLLRMIALLCGLAMITTALSAQQSSYVRQPGYWTFGLNGGFAYQDSDVPLLLKGWGAGATLGKNLYYSPNAPLSFDLRGRFLYSQTYGLDGERSFGINRNEALNGQNDLNYTTEGGGPGFVFQNHKTNQAELGLEGVFTLNQLRERHNVLFSFYGGLNLDWYKAQIDQSDFNGQYDDAYRNIAPNRSISSIRNDLRNNVLDGEYETNAHGMGESGKINFMPSLGVELGYQLTPTFSMGLGHKVTFARSDLLDGQQWNDNNNLTGDNDIHHYTSLHMRWELQPQEKQIPAPLITITQPKYNPYTTGDPNAIVRANIKHVNSAVDVSCTVNGRYQEFDFSGKNFTTRFILEPGSNEVIITARNTVGSDSKKVIIIYQEETYEPTPVNYPVVRFDNPPQNNYQVNEELFTVRATVKEVENKNDVRFFVNGNEVRNFSFNAYSDDFSSTVNLRPGNNTFRIEGRNNAGKDIAQTTVFFEEEIFIELPTVNITQPIREFTETEVNTALVRADIQNVVYKNDIEVRINGRTSSNFDWDANRGSLALNINLREGENIINIRARNADGQAEDQVNIRYRVPVIPVYPPRAEITSPRDRDAITRETIRMTGRVDKVNNRNGVSLYLNGREVRDFSFRSGRVEANLLLVNGDNTIRLVATNIDGTDQDQVTVNYCAPTPYPKVKIKQPLDGSRFDQATVDLLARVDYVEERRDIQVYLNGRNQSFSFNSNRKEVTSRLTLREGRNVIRVTAKNASGNAEDQVTVYYERQIAKPTVNITRPANNSTVDQSNTNLSATTQRVERKEDVKVYLNGRSIGNFTFFNGTVSANLDLREGSNTIRVTATNQGGSAEDEVRVTYKQNVPRPTVNIIRPANNSTIENPRTRLTASIRNVENKQDIKVYLNGNSINNFDYRNGTVGVDLTLREGRNNIRVTANNQGGSAEDEVQVSYKRNIPNPTVNINRPANNSTVENPRTRLNASIRNVENKQDIKVYLNGNTVNRFDYRNGTVAVDLNLREGRNTIRVTAKNETGSAEDQVNVSYQKPVAPPKVTITQPRPSRFSNTDVREDQTVKASITNVERKEDVGFYLNGKSIRDFTFSNEQFTANIKLKNGKNTIKVTGKNSAGKDEDQVTLTYVAPKPISKPKVSISSPIGKLKKNSATLKAQVENVASKNDITVLLDGKELNNFNYSGKLRQITANFKVFPGNHEITVIAKNRAGEARDTKKFSYEDPKPVVVKPEINNFTNSSPVINPMRPNTARTTIRATLSGVSSKKEIQMSVNGKAFTGFTFSQRSGNLIAPITLEKGTNTILLKVTTAGGMVKESKTIEF